MVLFISVSDDAAIVCNAFYYPLGSSGFCLHPILTAFVLLTLV